MDSGVWRYWALLFLLFLDVFEFDGLSADKNTLSNRVSKIADQLVVKGCAADLALVRFGLPKSPNIGRELP
jgi:hypothetical protein